MAYVNLFQYFSFFVKILIADSVQSQSILYPISPALKSLGSSFPRPGGSVLPVSASCKLSGKRVECPVEEKVLHSLSCPQGIPTPGVDASAGGEEPRPL